MIWRVLGNIFCDLKPIGQESIRSNTTTNGKVTNTQETPQDNQEVSPFPVGDHKTARTIQDSMTAKQNQAGFLL